MTRTSLAIGVNPYLNLIEIGVGCINHTIVIRVKRGQLRKSALPKLVAILVGGTGADHRKSVVQRAIGIGHINQNACI